MAWLFPIGREHLICNKKAVDRLQDRADVDALKRLEPFLHNRQKKRTRKR